MNILLITQEDILAGSTYSVSYLAKGLSARGHKVVVAARPGSVLSQLFEGTEVVFEPLIIKSRFDWQSVKKLVSLVTKHRINVINAQSSNDRYITVFARFFYHLPVVLVHTRRQVSMSVGGFLQNLIYVSGTDKIVAVSEGVKQSLVEKKTPAAHIEVIYNGTPDYKYKNVSEIKTNELRQKFGIKEGDIVVGSISRRKRQEQLLKALNFLEQPIKVILVGIHEDEELKQIRESWKLPHEVIYLGEIAQQEALNYYRLFTCTVLSSITEGLSQNLLESMYLGVPVIATAATGNLDLIKDGYNGLLFTDDDVEGLAASIKKIASDDKLRKSLIEGGITTAKDTFSIERTVANYESFYARLLSSRKL